MSIFTSSKVLGFENDELLGPTGAVAIPEFNTRFTRGMLVDTQPKDFNTLVRLSGFSHGTDVWLGNARDLIVSGTASVLETVGCRDDIMLYLIHMGLDPKMSFKIMEAVRKGKVKKGGFQDGWEDAMHAHNVPQWYIDSLAKIGYLFPKAHAVAYVMMAFRIAWFKVHRPLAFYATFFSIRAKAFDAEYCCAGIDAVKRKIHEIENNKDATAVEQNLMVTLEVCYEFYLRGFHFDTISIYDSDATRFKVTEGGLLPPLISVHGLGESAALDTVEKRKGKTFISVEEFSTCCNKLSKTHIEQLRALGAFAGMADTSQVSLFRINRIPREIFTWDFLTDSKGKRPSTGARPIPLSRSFTEGRRHALRRDCADGGDGDGTADRAAGGVSGGRTARCRVAHGDREHDARRRDRRRGLLRRAGESRALPARRQGGRRPPARAHRGGAGGPDGLT